MRDKELAERLLGIVEALAVAVERFQLVAVPVAEEDEEDAVGEDSEAGFE